MKKLFKSGVVIMCIFASTIFAQNFQLGISTKSISNSSALNGDEWNFNLDTWNLYVMTPDLISRVSNQTKKIVNIRLEIIVTVTGSTNSLTKILTFNNTKAPNGEATVKFKFDFTEVSGLDKKLLFDVTAYADGVQVGSLRRSVTMI
jgi:hypothetical protein